MSSLIKISEASILAIHTLAILSKEPGYMLTTKEISETLNASSAHLSKVLQRLTKAGLVKSVRGPEGGFILSCPAKDISLKTAFEAIEGPLEKWKCLLDKPICDSKKCMFGKLCNSIDEQIFEYFQNTNFADAAKHFKNCSYSPEKTKK